MGLDEKIKTAVERYQCAGCVCGSNTGCYEKNENSEACEKHVAGTIIAGVGIVFLGMPKGFNRLGECEHTRISIFKEWEDGRYDHLNVPVWKYKDEHGNVIIRSLSPRINKSCIHIFLTDCLAKIACHEITEKELSEMD